MITQDATVHELAHWATQAVDAVWHAKVPEMTPRQYSVLRTLQRMQPCSQTALVERTGVDRSTLADVIRRLVRQGLAVRRRTKEDARAYAVKITDQGMRALRNGKLGVEAVDAAVRSRLNNKQQAQLVALLSELAGLHNGEAKRSASK